MRVSCYEVSWGERKVHEKIGEVALMCARPFEFIAIYIIVED